MAKRKVSREIEGALRRDRAPEYIFTHETFNVYHVDANFCNLMKQHSCRLQIAGDCSLPATITKADLFEGSSESKTSVHIKQRNC